MMSLVLVFMSVTMAYSVDVDAARDGKMELAYEYIGRCLHYVQDANEPHHAANVHALHVLYGASHASFESYAEKYEEEFLGTLKSISSSYYTKATSLDIETITHNGAVEAKAMIEYVRNVLVQTHWYKYANKSMKNAAIYSAMVLYKFTQETSVPFYSN